MTSIGVVFCMFVLCQVAYQSSHVVIFCVVIGLYYSLAGPVRVGHKTMGMGGYQRTQSGLIYVFILHHGRQVSSHTGDTRVLIGKPLRKNVLNVIVNSQTKLTIISECSVALQAELSFEQSCLLWFFQRLKDFLSPYQSHGPHHQ